MTTVNSGLRAVGIALAPLAVAALVAACATSSSNRSSTSASASSTSRTALAACLRKHGVSFPSGGGAGGAPPAGVPGGGAGAPPAGGAPGGFPGGGAGASKFRAALKACGANFPAGGRRPGISRQGIEKYVTCVRQHGYNLPNPNLSGNGPVFPSNVRSNAKFQSANKECQGLLTQTRGSA